jgi:hypothetical protein
MPPLSLEEKKELILDTETAVAKRLAVKVFDKPTPPIWMIFIPVFFVFFATKMKEYKTGLKAFSENYLISRRWALEVAEEAVAGNHQELRIEPILEKIKDIPEEAKPSYRSWFLLLAEHYRLLLSQSGQDLPGLIRAGYRNRANFLLFCDRLGKAERTLNLALLPNIEGEEKEVGRVVEAMAQGIAEIRRQEMETIFT